MAMLYVPSHVNEASDPVDNLGGILSVVLVAALVLSINFAPVPDKRTLALGLAAIALAGLVAFLIRQRRAQNPLYDLQVAGRRIFWVAARAGVIVFGTLMGAMFVGQQFLQNVLGYSTFEAGLSILPAAACMVLAAPRSAKLVDAMGASFTLLAGYFFCLLGFLAMLLLWNDGIAYWKVGLAYALVGIGVGFAGTPASHSLTGSVPVRRAGMASGTADLQRDLAARSCSRFSGPSSPPGMQPRLPRRSQRLRTRSRSPTASQPADEVIRRRRGRRGAVPAICERDHRGAKRPSWTVRTGPTQPASSPSCSGRPSSSSSSRGARRRRGSWPPTGPRTRLVADPLD